MMRLGLSMQGLGYHLAAWRLPHVDPAAHLRIDHYVRALKAAEAAKFDMVFFADGNAMRGVDRPEGSLALRSKTVEFEPLTLLAALAMHSSHIGLVATASTTYNEPWHIARKFASIDHLSGGRAAWNAVTSWSDLEARNFNRDQHPEHGPRYDRAREFVDVVTGLWDSWEPDAFLRDKAAGVFFDPAKMHVLDHRGPNFQVRGPLTVSTTPQGRPILIQAGSSEGGQELAAATADVVYCAPFDLAAGRRFYASVKGRLAKHGRRAADMLIMPGIVPYIGRTRAEGQAKLDRLNGLIAPQVGLSVIAGWVGDLTGHDVDGPIPELDLSGRRSSTHHLVELARRENMSIRGLYEIIAAGNGSRPVAGSAMDLADEMEEWFTTGAADGFNIGVPYLPDGLDDFVTLVLPELRRRGLFRTEYEATTLRGHLGLPAHVNRHARQPVEGAA
jgi:FMN-dependent oxidoreductase (nitrilotriacetate monooxygenase family)